MKWSIPQNIWKVSSDAKAHLEKDDPKLIMKIADYLTRAIYVNGDPEEQVEM